MSCSIINVKTDFGAVGDGIADDTLPLQKAFNAAFGSDPTGVTYTANGKTNWQNNRPVFLPSGQYNTTSSLNLTQVYRGLIFGLGGGSYISYQGSTQYIPVLNINGMEECRLERFQVFGGWGIIGSQKTVTVPVAVADTLNFAVAHGYSVGTPIYNFDNTLGVLPTGLSANTSYFVKTVVDANNIKLSSYPGSATVAITSGTGSGTIVTAKAGAVGVELDWDGSGSVQLQNNLFYLVVADKCPVAFRIAKSGNGGANNNLFGCRMSNSSIGANIVGVNATDNALWWNSAGHDGGALVGSGHDGGVGISCDGGSFIAHGCSISSNRNHVVINSATACTVAGSRMEVGNCGQIGSGSTLRLAGVWVDGPATVASGGSLIVDGSHFDGAFGYVDGAGDLKLRASTLAAGHSGVTLSEDLN